MSANGVGSGSPPPGRRPAAQAVMVQPPPLAFTNLSELSDQLATAHERVNEAKLILGSLIRRTDAGDAEMKGPSGQDDGQAPGMMASLDSCFSDEGSPFAHVNGDDNATALARTFIAATTEAARFHSSHGSNKPPPATHTPEPVSPSSMDKVTRFCPQGPQTVHINTAEPVKTSGGGARRRLAGIPSATAHLEQLKGSQGNAPTAPPMPRHFSPAFEEELGVRYTMGGSIDLRSLPAMHTPVSSQDSEISDEAMKNMDSRMSHISSEFHRQRSNLGVTAMNLRQSLTTVDNDNLKSDSGPFRRSMMLGHVPVAVMKFRSLALFKSEFGHHRKRGCIINPEQSTKLQYWDTIALSALAWVAIIAPVQVSMMQAKFDLFFGFNCMIDLIFLLDLILQFFLMYTKKTDYGYVLEQNHRKIVRHYLKTWFTIDLLSIIPFDALSILIQNDDMKKMKAVKVVRLLRLLKLVRVLKASRLFRRFEVRMSITYGTFALLKFFAILLLITHWLANFWALTLVLVDESDGVPRWIDAFDETDANVVDKTKDTPWKLYLVCLYFTSYTITSVGYGDIGPSNIVETIVCTIMIIISGISWAVVLGQVCGIITNLNSDESAFRAIMDELNFMMSDRVIPRDMQRRLRSFFLSNKLAQRRARHRRVIEAMSPGLKGEVLMELNRIWIRKVSFLDSILTQAENTAHGPFFYSFVVDISTKMENPCHAQSEVFGVMQAMYILSRGLVSRMGKLNSAGAVWGVDFVLSDLRLLESPDCLALTYVEAMLLKRADFFELVEYHKSWCPGLKQKVRRFCCWLAFQRAFMKEAKKRMRKEEKKREREEAKRLAEDAQTASFNRISSPAESYQGGAFGFSPVMSQCDEDNHAKLEAIPNAERGLTSKLMAAASSDWFPDQWNPSQI